MRQAAAAAAAGDAAAAEQHMDAARAAASAVGEPGLQASAPPVVLCPLTSTAPPLSAPGCAGLYAGPRSVTRGRLALPDQRHWRLRCGRLQG